MSFFGMVVGVVGAVVAAPIRILKGVSDMVDEKFRRETEGHDVYKAKPFREVSQMTLPEGYRPHLMLIKNERPWLGTVIRPDGWPELVQLCNGRRFKMIADIFPPPVPETGERIWLYGQDIRVDVGGKIYQESPRPIFECEE